MSNHNSLKKQIVKAKLDKNIELKEVELLEVVCYHNIQTEYAEMLSTPIVLNIKFRGNMYGLCPDCNQIFFSQGIPE